MLRISYESVPEQLRKCSGAVAKVFRINYGMCSEAVIKCSGAVSKCFEAVSKCSGVVNKSTGVAF